jgi:hypothetical protein
MKNIIQHRILRMCVGWNKDMVTNDFTNFPDSRNRSDILLKTFNNI